MKIIQPKKLSLIIFTLFLNYTISAQTPTYCPRYTALEDLPPTDDFRKQPVYIDADMLRANYPFKGIYEGNVVVEQGTRSLRADKAEVIQTENNNQRAIRRVTATGNVVYRDRLIELKSPIISASLDKNDIDVAESQYHFISRAGRGNAKSITIRDGRYSVMENGQLTLCPLNDNSWKLKGSTIKHDQQEEVAEIWNAVFEIGSVPVLYLPYLQFPTSDRRRSGLLIPDFKYSKNNGIEITIPYYLNLAPNFDATITPHYISRRGLQLQNEFRYLLNDFGQGLFSLDYLPYDRLYKRDYQGRNKRWLFFWEHDMLYDKQWRFNVDYTDVSDGRYFNDLSSTHGSETDGYATQKLSTGYSNSFVDIMLSTSKFQVFDPTVNDVYKAYPQLDINFYLTELPYINFYTYIQATRFESNNKNDPKATRIHIEPTINYAYSNLLGNIETSASLLMTHYNQSVPAGYSGQLLEPNTSRILPKFKIDGRMIFEREMLLPQLKRFTQTIEPRVQYLYISFHDQSHIYNYDSVMLQPDYRRLFSDNTFSGLDRIASANQITTGLTTRIYDSELVERFNFSIGQIYYVRKSRTGDEQLSFDKWSDVGSSTWATDGFLKFNNELSMQAGIQYDKRLGEIAIAQSVIEYRHDADRILQLSYRYAKQEYLSALDLNRYSPYKQNISQVGVVGSWPMTENIMLFGSYYYDTKLNQLSDSFIGMQYNACCWGANIIYNRKIDNWDSLLHKSTYDNRISINFELRGFGRENKRSSTKKLLNSGLIPYQPVF